MQVHRHVEKSRTTHAVNGEGDIVLVKLVVALVVQKFRDALTFLVELVDREPDPFLQHLVVGLVELQQLRNALVLNIVVDVADEVGFARMQQIADIHLAPFLPCLAFNGGIEIAHVLHSAGHIKASALGEQRVVNYLLTAEQTAVSLLLDIRLQARSIDIVRIGHHPDAVQQKFVVAQRLVGSTRNRHQQQQQGSCCRREEFRVAS